MSIIKSQNELIKVSVYDLKYQQYGLTDLYKIRNLVEGAKEFYEVDKTLDSTNIDLINECLTALIFLHLPKSFEDLFNKIVIDEEATLAKLKDASMKLE